jgi:hypothetical protein
MGIVMPKKLKPGMAALFVFFFIFVRLIAEENVQWKGKIESEDEVKVIINPKEPLFGEITFELEEDLRIGKEEDDNYMFYRIRGMAVDPHGNIYVVDMTNFRVQIFDKKGKYIKTIGRSGQGPGEFEQPNKMRINSSNGDIYVRDMYRTLDIFNKNGEFIKSLKLNNGIQDFFPLKNNTILALLNKSSDEELTSVNILCKIDDKGETLGSIAEFPRTWLAKRMSGGGVFSTSTGHELTIHFAVLDQEKMVYGYSKDYVLSVMDRYGQFLYLIKKDDPRPKFDSKEQSEYKRMKFPVPDHKPYFYWIFSDSKGRIYVQRNKTVDVIRGYGPFEKVKKQVDIFSKNGYFLYEASLPPNTCVIKDGFLYTRDLDEEEGMEYIVRFKIKNWDQIKEGSE